MSYQMLHQKLFSYFSIAPGYYLCYLKFFSINLLNKKSYSCRPYISSASFHNPINYVTFPTYLYKINSILFPASSTWTYRVLNSWVLHPAFLYIKQHQILKRTNCLTLPILHLTTSKNFKFYYCRHMYNFIRNYPYYYQELILPFTHSHLVSLIPTASYTIIPTFSRFSNTNRPQDFSVSLLLYFLK
jgi:hypothetical protein